MVTADQALDAFRAAGFGLATGVPCSFLTPLINAFSASPAVDYVGAVNEGDAVALACGAELAGTPAVAMFQNSGLGNAVNPLTSLASTFRIPVLLITTWRGEPGGAPDEPQHELMGRITPRLLDLLEIPHELFPGDPEALRAALARARRAMQATGLPYAFILQKGTLAATGGEAVPLTGTRGSARAERAPRTRFDPDQALRAIQASVAEPTALVATTGYTGRALYAAGDRPGQLYMVGSMGCALSLGLGIARVRPKLRVVVLDGDGALLMRMGAMATAGSVHPANLVHVLLDNGVHDSTGAQRTVAPFVDFGGIALASGYQSARLIEDLGELPGALAAKGPAFVHLPTLPRSDPKLPRPKDGPVAQARRFRAFVQGTQG